MGAPEPLDRALLRFDRWQRRHAVVGFPVAVGKFFAESAAGRLAAVLAYYAFFSVFPLLLVLVTITGFVLEGQADLRDSLVDSALGQVPVLGSELTSEQGLGGSGLALVIGLVGAAWAGMGVGAAAQHAMNEVFDVPPAVRPNPLTRRLRAALVLLVVFLGIVGAATVNGLSGQLPALRGAVEIPLALATVTIDVMVLWVAFQLLTAPSVGWKRLFPGALLGGIAYFGLQLLGEWVVREHLSGSSDVYGTFAVVIGLLGWFHLLAQVTLLAAVVNVVVARRLYPRCVWGDHVTDADREAYQAHLAGAVHDERVRSVPLRDLRVGDGDDEPVTAGADDDRSFR